jgi:hypothetical protein
VVVLALPFRRVFGLPPKPLKRPRKVGPRGGADQGPRQCGTNIPTAMTRRLICRRVVGPGDLIFTRGALATSAQLRANLLSRPTLTRCLERTGHRA